jgi:drug/metabolite transporter (DMT)-like permease
MKPFHLGLLLLMNLFWGGVYSAYKVIGPDLPVGGIVTIRFGLAGVCLLLAWPWLPGKCPRGRDLAITALMGLMLYVLGQRLQVAGNQLGTAGNSAVLMALEPLVTSVAAAIFLREHIGPRRLAGFALGLFGVATLNGAWKGDIQWAGLGASLMFVSSFICEAAYSVIGKKIIARVGIMKMLAISLLVGAAMNLVIDGPATVRAAAALPPRAWVLLAWLAIVCTVIGYTLWFVVIRDCPVNVAALTIFAQSVFGVAIAAICIGEPVHGGQIVGSLVIVAGLVLGLSRQIRFRSRPAPRSG